MKENKKIISLIIAILFILMNLIECYASAIVTSEKNYPKNLRVAFYPLSGFFEYDKSGKECGYGVELLDKISDYTGIDFTYVKADSWEETKKMLLDDRADIRLPATMPTKPSTTLSYNSSSIIDTYHVILTSEKRKDLYYEDYNNLKKIKIAMSEGFYDVTNVKNYLDKIGISYDQIVFCDEYNDCRKMLDEGKVDALVSNIMDKTDDLKILARFNNISNYITMTLNNPDLDILENAIAKIKLDEPMFMSNLYVKWFPDRTIIPFTISENEYLNSIDTITFAFRKNEGYLQHYDNGQFYGVYVEQAKTICQKLGKKFRAVSLEACLSKKETADVYVGFFYDKKYANEKGVSITSPISNINYYTIEKKDAHIDDKTCKIAAIKEFRYTKEYLQKKYKPEQFIYYSSYEDCLKAVESGVVDIAVINNYIAEYYLEKYQFSDLTVKLTTDYSHLYCLAIPQDNEILTSVLSKIISTISEDEMKLIYIRGIENKPNNSTIMSLIYRNPMQFSLVVVLLSIIIIAFLMLLIFIKNSKKKNRVLSEALSAKSDFLARMSHDMRTPLNAVLGFATIAKEDDGNSENVNDCLSKIKSSGTYLLGLINDVLDASKMENDNIVLNPEIVEGRIFLSAIAEEFKSQARRKGINLEVNLEKANTGYIILDKIRTRQIYSNLLNNALKFTKKGGTVKWFMEDILIDEKHMKFISTISDNGCGMSEEFLKHLFEPFTQEVLDGQERQEGTGLGLMIVKQIIELSGGTIEVESEVNKGSTFTIKMERELPTKEQIEEYEKNKTKTPKDYSILIGKQILLCEDHPLNREIAVRILKKVGANVICAENGEMGVETFKNSEIEFFDAVLMDIRMPKMDGLEATKNIRLLNRTDAISVPIIAMTANAYEDDIKKSIEAGMNAHLAKPIEPNILYQELASQIEKHSDKGVC